MTTAAERAQIVAEAAALLEAETRAIREADEANPVLPSIRNNSLGAAQIVLDRFFTTNGICQIAYYRENWYSYYKKIWSQRHADDIQHFIHNKLRICRQVDAEGDVQDFNCAQRNVSELLYQIQNLTSIPSHFRAPVALIDGKWVAQDARGKMVCRGQIVDLMSGEVQSNHHLFIPNGAEWEYNAKAKPPKSWMKFLCDLFGEKQDEVQLLQEWMGYVLSGDTWAHKGLVLVGPPRAGKGTIGHVLTSLMGPSMVASPSLHSLGKDFGLQPLIDKRLCLISDARLSNRADIMAVIEVLLRITACDQVNVARKHKDSLDLVLDTRVMMLSNEMPLLADNSFAINTRFLILSLGNSFLGKEDTKLIDKLNAELPGIALWCVEGYRRLRERGKFIEPLSSDTAREEWYHENNPLAQFIEDRCSLAPDAKVEMTKLYEAYRSWSEARGSMPLAANALSRKISTVLMGKVGKSKVGSTRYLTGIAVNPGDF